MKRQGKAITKAQLVQLFDHLPDDARVYLKTEIGESGVVDFTHWFEKTGEAGAFVVVETPVPVLCLRRRWPFLVLTWTLRSGRTDYGYRGQLPRR